MHSFFLAETCKYLFLTANDTFVRVSQIPLFKDCMRHLSC